MKKKLNQLKQIKIKQKLKQKWKKIKELKKIKMEEKIKK